jgi:hypothetical protein
MKPREGRSNPARAAARGMGASNVLYDIVQPLRGYAISRHPADEAGQTAETALARSARREPGP